MSTLLHAHASVHVYRCTWMPENKFKCSSPGATLFFPFIGRSLAWNLPSALCPVRHRDLPVFVFLPGVLVHCHHGWLLSMGWGGETWVFMIIRQAVHSPNPSGPLKHASWKKSLESTNFFLHYCLAMRNDMMIDYFCIPLSRGYPVNESKCGLQLDLERLAIKEFALTFLFHSITF